MDLSQKIYQASAELGDLVLKREDCKERLDALERLIARKRADIEQLVGLRREVLGEEQRAKPTELHALPDIPGAS
jgi:CHASE3 domain sensor protein